MAVSIADQITDTWPKTEAILSEDTEVGYADKKARATARAKIALYGSETVPDEGSIPDVAAYWIADRAVRFLIPLAKDYYGTVRHVTSSKDGANITHYNLLQSLDRLESELAASNAEALDAALAAIGTTEEASPAPAVSHKGMAVDPMGRAMGRGPAP